MPTLIRYRWHVTDPASGRTYLTRCHMTEADAKATDPNAEPAPLTRQVLVVPDDPYAMCAGWLMCRPDDDGTGESPRD